MSLKAWFEVSNQINIVILTANLNKKNKNKKLLHYYCLKGRRYFLTLK